MLIKKWLFILALVATAVITSGMIIKPAPEPVYVTAEARIGETAWDMACALAQKYGDERDMRAIIYDAEKLNGMDLTNIKPGQKIKFRLEPEK